MVPVAAGLGDPEIERLVLVLETVPISGRAVEADAAVAGQPPDARARRGGQQLDVVAGVLHHELGPRVHPVTRRSPAVVQVLDVEVVVDVEELEQVEEERRHVAVCHGADVRDRAGTRDAGVQLAEIELAGGGVGEEVELEVAAITLRPEALAHRPRPLPRQVVELSTERMAEDLVAAPAASVRRQLAEPRELGHERADQRPVAGDDALDRKLLGVDPPHDLEVLALQLVGVALPVGGCRDEERRLARVAVRRLDDEVRAEAGSRREPPELGVGPRPAEHIRHRRHAGLVAEPGRHDLAVEAVAQRGAREAESEAGFLGQPLGLLVEHQERRQATGPAVGPVRVPPGWRRSSRVDEVADLLVADEVVHDLLDRLEGARLPLLRDDDVRMAAIEAVVVVDVPEVPDPAVDAQQVERGRTDEVDRRLVRPEERPDVGHAIEMRPAPGLDGSAPCPRTARRRRRAQRLGQRRCGGRRDDARCSGRRRGRHRDHRGVIGLEPSPGGDRPRCHCSGARCGHAQRRHDHAPPHRRSAPSGQAPVRVASLSLGCGVAPSPRSSRQASARTSCAVAPAGGVAVVGAGLPSSMPISCSQRRRLR